MPARLASSGAYWRQLLSVAKDSPRALAQVVTRLTGQAVRDLDLDPTGPLASMAPLGLFEEQGKMVRVRVHAPACMHACGAMRCMHAWH